MESRTFFLPKADRDAVANSIFSRMAQLMRPKPRWNIWQYAEAKRFLGKGVSFKSINGPVRYSTKSAPHQREPQESFTDPTVQKTILLMASQIGGKTEQINNCVFYHVEHKPSGIVIMYPTIESAEKYSKKKFTPSANATPSLKEVLKDSRSRDSGNTILVKDFLGGSIYFIGANSTTSLRGATGSVLIGDEIDSMEETPEGDPVELLWKRGESFPNCVKILSSTPTIKGASRIWSEFEISDQRYWFVPCVKCGIHQTFQWKNVVWPEGKPEDTYYLCSHCAAALDDKQRVEMYFNGEWRPTAPFKGIRGYHLNGIYCPWPAQKGYKNRLHQMASEHLAAHKKGKSAVRVWVNTFLTECFEDEAEQKPDSEALATRCEDYGGEDKNNPIVPEDVYLLVAAVDIQNDRLELTVTGYGMAEETWGIEHLRIWGDTKKPDVWNDLDTALNKTYTHELGAKLKIAICVIDTGDGKNQKAAYQFIKPRQGRRIFAVKGSSTPNAPLLATAKLQKKSRVQLFTIGTDTAKATIYGRLSLSDHGQGFMHYPKGFGFDPEYFKQLTAESCVTVYSKGVAKRAWKKDRERNEALDNRVYTLGAYEILNPNMAKLKSLIESQAPQAEQKTYELKPSEEPKQKPQPPKEQAGFVKKFTPRRGGFVNGWRK